MEVYHEAIHNQTVKTAQMYILQKGQSYQRLLQQMLYERHKNILTNKRSYGQSKSV